MKFNIVVAGAGSAGCMAAYTAAKRGFDVCLIDRKPRERVGDKICGNALGNHHLDMIDLSLPNDTITNTVDGLVIYSPDLNSWRVPGEEYKGVMLDRYKFGQYLLDQALSAGATLMDGTKIKKPIIVDDYVKGVEVHPTEKVYGDMTIDSLGLRSFIRSNLPESFGIETEIENKDVDIAYRQIRKVRERIDDENYCSIYLNPDIYSGGYGWIFPQDERTMNVGLGVQKVTGHPNPRKRLYETLLQMELFEGSKIVEMNGRKQAGGMEVPTRRAIPSFVWNGLIIAGEAGVVIDPVTGSGNGQALVTGKFAAEHACDAIEEGDVSKEKLWPYNIRYYTDQNGYGLRYTPIDAFRIFLQCVTPDDINYARRHDIIKEQDLLRLTTKGKLKMSITDKAARAFRSIGRFSLLKNLYYVKNVMEEVRECCLNYPTSPAGISTWQEKMNSIFADLERKFKPYAPK